MFNSLWEDLLVSAGLGLMYSVGRKSGFNDAMIQVEKTTLTHEIEELKKQIEELKKNQNN